MHKTYHILSLSGGKDSTALAFFMRENYPEIWDELELVFCDTQKEIPETYDYLNKIEVFLNKKIIRIRPERSFDHIYLTRKIIPSVANRWCTVELKIRPFENFLKKHCYNNKVNIYIGIRADEKERTKNSERNNKENLKTIYPFVDFGVCKNDIERILQNTGIGYSNYYKWRKRSGCYFCMFQSKNDWLNLYKHHPDLYKKAMSYEYKKDEEKNQDRFGWNVDMSLEDMIKPENMRKIKEKYKNKKIINHTKKLINVF